MLASFLATQNKGLAKKKFENWGFIKLVVNPLTILKCFFFVVVVVVDNLIVERGDLNLNVFIEHHKVLVEI